MWSKTSLADSLEAPPVGRRVEEGALEADGRSPDDPSVPFGLAGGEGLAMAGWEGQVQPRLWALCLTIGWGRADGLQSVVIKTQTQRRRDSGGQSRLFRRRRE